MGRADLRAPLEQPYLDGSAVLSAARPDRRRRPDGRAVAALPARPDRRRRGGCTPLPADGSVPGMPGWRWLHTPGHAPGHVSLWREADRTLIAGDAFITTAQESALRGADPAPGDARPADVLHAGLGQRPASRCERLAALEPELAVTGHGPAMRGAGDARRRCTPWRGTSTASRCRSTGGMWMDSGAAVQWH